MKSEYNFSEIKAITNRLWRSDLGEDASHGRTRISQAMYEN